MDTMKSVWPKPRINFRNHSVNYVWDQLEHKEPLEIQGEYRSHFWNHTEPKQGYRRKQNTLEKQQNRKLK